MFDIGFDEMLAIAIVAIVVIGPKDLPTALRTFGRWVAKVRRVSGHFRSGVESMIREAELEEMEKTWRDHNAAIMATTGDAAAAGPAWPDGTGPDGTGPDGTGDSPPAVVAAPTIAPASAEAALARSVPVGAPRRAPRRAPRKGVEPTGPPLSPP